MLTIHNLTYRQLNRQQTATDLRRRRIVARGEKCRRGRSIFSENGMSWSYVSVFRKRGFCPSGRGRSFRVEGSKTEKARNQKWKVWYEDSAGWKRRKQTGGYRRVCTVEDSHRDKTEQCTTKTWIADGNCHQGKCKLYQQFRHIIVM